MRLITVMVERRFPDIISVVSSGQAMELKQFSSHWRIPVMMR